MPRFVTWQSSALMFALLSACGPTTGSEGVQHDPARDALWHIVDDCINERELTCTCPALLKSCCGDPDEPARQAIWALSKDYVVIRDMLACGCEALVWGLAMPRARVTGIEDPRRPEGIWPFAWKVARTKIDDPGIIALVLNPETRRSQDQMHVHILRLNERAKAFLAGDSRETERVQIVPLPRLEEAFAVAKKTVGEEALPRTGLLVARARSGPGWTVLLFDDASPKAFATTTCERANQQSGVR